MKTLGILPTRWRDGWIVLITALPRLTYLLVTTPSFSGHYWALSDGLLRDGSLAIDGQKTTEFEPTGPTGRITVEHTQARPFLEVISYAVSSSVVLVCALAGVFLRRRHLRGDAILGSIVLTFVAGNAMYVPATRYRAPTEFVLLFYAATALAREAASSTPRPEEWKSG
jgi:hypothetical protein